jgi:hypothetical protein
VNHQIDQVVAENINSPKIIVQGKGKVRKDSDGLFIGKPRHLFQAIPRQNLNLDTLILDNIGRIIKIKRGFKGIGVDEEGYSCNQANRNEIPEVERFVVHLSRIQST